MRFGDMLRVMPRMLRLMPLFKKWNGMTIKEFTARLKNRFVRAALQEIWLPEMSALMLAMTLSWFHGRQAGYAVDLAQALDDYHISLDPSSRLR